jgi:AcrR family transcriptional regulator
MQELLSKVSVRVNEKIYLKDPESSELGRRIISGSVELIDRIGFEAFTFKKLGQLINSPEASVYRYFESKHKLLLYLSSWYWGWMEYRLVFEIANVRSPEERLERAIHTLTGLMTNEDERPFIEKTRLHRIVISESSKAYLTKDVDLENKDGVFSGYKQLVERVSAIIQEINPEYRYPHMLISTVIEGSLHQRYFAEHLPRLTDVVEGEDSVTAFYTDLVFKAIK